MLRCSVCNAAIEKGYICKTCGYDESRNYDKYVTLQPLRGTEHSILFFRQKRELVHIEKLIQSIIEPYNQRIQELEAKVAALEAKNTASQKQNAETEVSSAERINTISEKEYAPIQKCSYRKGDIITFGHYPYESDGTKKPIEWQILDLDLINARAFVISKYGVDGRSFHEKKDHSIWESCTLRIWLNKTFYQSAFSSAEQNRILNMDRNYTGNDVQDKLFPLSVNEAKKYFASDDDRVCVPTDYAVKKGVYKYSSRGPSCRWWLRSTDGYSGTAVTEFGIIQTYSISQNRELAVRPAMWVSLEV